MNKIKKKPPNEPPTLMEIPTIGPDEKFYGYVVSLGVGLSNSSGHDRNCYAMFEYNGERSVWLVPDLDLFEELGKHLNGMAYFRFTMPDDYGYSKLYIGKTETGTWSVQTP